MNQKIKDVTRVWAAFAVIAASAFQVLLGGSFVHVTAISATYAVPTRPTPGSIKEADILNLRYMGPNESQSPEWITLGPRESALPRMGTRHLEGLLGIWLCVHRTPDPLGPFFT